MLASPVRLVRPVRLDKLVHLARLARLARFLMVPLFLLQCVSAGAASREEIDARVREALTNFESEAPAGFELAKKAAGVLVFPNVIKAGIGLGGEYGEGVLQIKGAHAGYYSIAAASIGFQLGAQARNQVILFMNQSALDTFRHSQGWKAGVDASVALATLGAGGAIDSETLNRPIIGFIFSGKGLMYNLTFEGSKISRIDR
jgi:lipid-binding SYLF domain-containing protein